MKLFFYFLTCLLVSSFIHAQQNPRFHTQQDKVASIPQSPDWFQNASQAINERQLRFQPIQKDLFAAVNPANKLSFCINPAGYTVRDFNANGQQTWVANFSVASVNNQPMDALAGYSFFTTNEDELTYRFPLLDINYQNKSEGLRQNFIVKNKMGDKLKLVLAINTELSVKLSSESGLSLTNDKGHECLSYDGLVVWDAQHKRLPAYMELSGKDLSITVDDRNAIYPVTIDPLNHTADWSDTGNGLVLPLVNDLTTPVLFGYSVSDAGDINNDGFGDIIVGAPAYVDIINISAGTFNITSVGAAFIYYGSASGPGVNPNEVLQPTTQAGALFGFSVSKAGDVNNDGYGDVIVGAPGDRITLNVGVIPVATSVATGKVYIYYGGPAGTFDGNVNTEPTVSVTLSLTQANFGALLSVPQSPLYGFSVSEGGDVNGDGYGDVIVGSPAYLRLLPLPLRTGRVDVYHGSASGITNTPAATITGTLLSGLFGFSVSTAGNVNNDMLSGRNVSDIIVGAPGSLSILSTGQAFVFHGSASGITATSSASANTTLSSGFLSTLFGYSVSNAGDVNGDGYKDVIVGEPASVETLLTQTAAIGSATIYYGSSSGIITSGSTQLTSPRRPSLLGLLNGNLLFGYSVSTAGDVDCNGFDDVLIGEPGGTSLTLGSGLLGLISANVLAGQTYIYSGNSTKPVNTPMYTVGETGALTLANLVGYCVSAGGDYNGDGKADILIGAPNGTLDLAGGIVPLVGSVLNMITTSSIGSAYGYSGCLQPNITLPVSFINFAAWAEGESVKLQWIVGQEENISHYAIERSANGKDFETISIVFPAGAGSGVTYNYHDEHPLAVNYYRIKPVSMLNEKYSSIQVVRFSKTKYSLSVSPNPAKDNYMISFSNFSAGNYVVQLHNIMGALVATKQINLQGESYNLPMTRRGITPGIYSIDVYSSEGEKLSSARIVLQ